jgi:hypothetical protein
MKNTMEEIIEETILQTKWGLAIPTKNIERYSGKRDFAFLSYSGNHKDFEIGKKYDCGVFYQLNYVTSPDISAHHWKEIKGKSVENVLNKKCFLEFHKPKKKFEFDNFFDLKKYLYESNQNFPDYFFDDDPLPRFEIKL